MKKKTINAAPLPIIGDLANWARVKPPFGLHIFFEKGACFQQMYYALDTVVSEANAGNQIHPFSGNGRYMLAIHEIYHSAVLSHLTYIYKLLKTQISSTSDFQGELIYIIWLCSHTKCQKLHITHG